MAKQLRSLGILVAALTLLFAGSASAHFKLNQNVRIFHVAHGEDGLDVYIRAPLPFLLADKLGPMGSDGLPEPAPFTFNTLKDGALFHVIDPVSLTADPLGLARIMADDLILRVDGDVLNGNAIAVRMHAIGSEPGFATRAEAVEALAGGTVFLGGVGDVYVGDAVVDIRLHYPWAQGSTYALSVAANPGLPGQEETANLVLDYRDNNIRAYRASGLLNEPIEVTGAASAAALTFVFEGVRHIVEGIDHVLFVICLVVGAATLPALLARVTGFTLGHTVTLIMGFFGLAPSAPWFIPAVETAIALSIILAAADAVFQPADRKRSNLTAVGVTAAIGLLHGFGFSFMLRNILQVDADNVWQSLLAFNIGVEVGQLMIVILVWPLVLILRRMPDPIWLGTRGAIALSVSVVAAIWAVERVGGVLV